MALTDKLTSIANAIREKTGNSDLLTLDEMASAISNIETGGSGGSASSIRTGSFITGENTLEVSVDIGGICNNFVLFPMEIITGKGVKAGNIIVGDNTNKYVYYSATNNSGTTLSISQKIPFYEETNAHTLYKDAQSIIEFDSNNVLIQSNATTGNVFGHFVSGIEYRWFAW